MSQIAATLHILTWGYNRTAPPTADLVADVRWIPAPWQQSQELSGLDAPVQNWIFAHPAVTKWFGSLLDVIGPMLAAAQERPPHRVTVAIGCDGGHGRSVAIATRLAEVTQNAGVRTRIRHLSAPEHTGLPR